jgi:hypothetical protein
VRGGGGGDGRGGREEGGRGEAVSTLALDLRGFLDVLATASVFSSSLASLSAPAQKQEQHMHSYCR